MGTLGTRPIGWLPVSILPRSFSLALASSSSSLGTVIRLTCVLAIELFSVTLAASTVRRSVFGGGLVSAFLGVKNTVLNTQAQIKPAMIARVMANTVLA